MTISHTSSVFSANLCVTVRPKLISYAWSTVACVICTNCISLTRSYFVKHKRVFFLPALKVHCSKECKEILDKLGGYTLEERGYVSMKVCYPYPSAPFYSFFFRFFFFFFSPFFFSSVQSCCQRASPCQDLAGNWTTQKSLDDRKETQTAVVRSYFPFIRSGQNHLARHSEREKKTRRTEEEVGTLSI